MAGPTDSVFKTWAATQLELIRAEAPPGWDLWYVTHGGATGESWHAIPPGGNRAAVNADTPTDLLAAIRDPAPWLSAELARTEKQRDETPKHHYRERDYLTVQLTALQRLSDT
jgi:hypothetical protein